MYKFLMITFHRYRIKFSIITGSTMNFPYLLRMMAADTIQSQALVDLVEYMGWTRLAILTSNTDYGKQNMHSFNKMLYLFVFLCTAC